MNRYLKNERNRRMCFLKLILRRQNYDRLGHGNGQVARERNIVGRDVTYEATRTLSTQLPTISLHFYRRTRTRAIFLRDF